MLYYCLVLGLAVTWSGGCAKSVSKLDMSHKFNKDTLYWPAGQWNFSNEVFITEGNGGLDWYQGGQYRAGEHGGTHMDAPIHFARGRWAMDEIPLDRLEERPAVVVDVRSKVTGNRNYAVTVDDLREWESSNGQIPEGAVLFMCAGWDLKWPDKMAVLGNDRDDTTDFSFPGYHPDAVEWLTDNREVFGVGVDTPSIDPGNSTTFAAHTTLMAKNIYGLENVKGACELPQRGATVNITPMKIEGASGGPVGIIATWGAASGRGSSSAGSFSTLQMYFLVGYITVLVAAG